MNFKRERSSRLLCPGYARCLKDCLGAYLDYCTIFACAKDAAALHCCRTIVSKEEWQKSMAICSNLDKAELRKDQITAGVQVVLSKHCPFLSSLHLWNKSFVLPFGLWRDLYFSFTREKESDDLGDSYQVMFLRPHAEWQCYDLH